MIRRSLISVFALVVAVSLSACFGMGGAKSAWNDVIKRCGESSLNGREVMFFGPTNAVGPGSVWRKDDEGVFRLRYDLSQMPRPQTFTAPFSSAQCDGTYSSKVNFGLDANLSAVPVSAELQADFKKARKVSAKADSVAWVPIAEGPYENYVRGLSASDPVRQDLETGNRLVMTRALQVSGFTTSLSFSAENAATLKAKYPNGPLPAGLVGDLGGGLNASWSADNTLTITNAGTFYIAGEFQRFSTAGLSSAGSSFGPRESVGRARAVRDTLDQ